MPALTPIHLGTIDGAVLKPAVVDSAAGGNIPSPSGAADSVIRVYSLFLVIGGTTNITFLDGSTEFGGAMGFTTGGTIVLDHRGVPWFTTSNANAFNINSSMAVQVSGTVYYTQVSADSP